MKKQAATSRKASLNLAAVHDLYKNGKFVSKGKRRAKFVEPKPFRCLDANGQLTPEFIDDFMRMEASSRNKQFYTSPERIMEKINSYPELRDLPDAQKAVIRALVRSVHHMTVNRACKVSEMLRHDVSPQMIRMAL